MLSVPKNVGINETVKENILNAESLKSHISKAFGNYGKNSDSSNEWYSFDKSGNPERKELSADIHEELVVEFYNKMS